MSQRIGRAWLLLLGMTVTVVPLVGALPVESAVQLAEHSPDTERAVSCTAAGVSEERATSDEAPPPAHDGPRVAQGERASDGQLAPPPDPAHPEVCPLHPEQEPVPPRGRP